MICICKACNEPIDFDTQNFLADDDGDYMHSACYCRWQDAEFFDKVEKEYKPLELVRD